MTVAQHVNYLVEEDSVITDKGNEVTVFHLIPSDEDTSLNEWARSLRENYITQSLLDKFVDKTGLSQEEYLKKYKFPDHENSWGKSTMVGDFAEILIADYLKYVKNYVVPRTRYDAKIRHNSSTQGSDLIAYQMNNVSQWSSEDELLVFEVKAQSSETKPEAKLQEAVDHSAKDYVRLGESLIVSAQRLEETGREEDADVVYRFLNGTDRPYVLHYGGAAVHSNRSFSKDVIKQLDISEHPDKEVQLIVVHCEKLLNFIISMYERALKC